MNQKATAPVTNPTGARMVRRLDVEGVGHDVVTAERGRVEDLPVRGL